MGVLDRALAILDAVDDGAHTFTDLVEATGLSRTTTHRLVGALEAHGFVARVGGLGYRLGPRLLRLAATASRDLPLRDLAHPAVERLAAGSGESAQLFVRSGDRRLCVDAVESGNELRTIVPIGADLPLTAGSAAKIFLAWTGQVDRERVLGQLEPYTPTTPGAQAMLEQVEMARRRGWAHSSGEREPGVASVSAPILGSNEELLAVISVSGPATRMGRGRAGRYVPPVLAAAREIQDALGVS